MTFNGSWAICLPIDWHWRGAWCRCRKRPPRRGNPPLNIGPRPDGSVPDEAYDG